MAIVCCFVCFIDVFRKSSCTWANFKTLCYLCLEWEKSKLYYLGISHHISLIDPFKARCLLHIYVLLDITPKLCILLIQLTFPLCMILNINRNYFPCDINRLVFLTRAHSVLYEVGTGFLYTLSINCNLQLNIHSWFVEIHSQRF